MMKDKRCKKLGGVVYSLEIRSLLFALPLLFLLPSGCVKEHKDVEQLSPDWKDVERTLIEEFRKPDYYGMYDDPSIPLTIDFMKTHGAQFIMVYSIRAPEETKVYRCFGRVRDTEIVIRYLEPDGEVLTGNGREKYTHLLATNQVWSLLGEDGFWESSEEWDLMESNLRHGTRYREHEHTQGLLFIRYDYYKDTLSQDIWNNPPADVVRFAVGTAALKNYEDSLLFGFESSSQIDRSIDLFVHEGLSIALLVTLRSPDLIVCLPVVGKLNKGILSFRGRPEGPYSFAGPRMDEYRDLQQGDSLWSLLSPDSPLQGETSIRQLYRSYKTDSASASAIVIDLDTMRIGDR